MLLDDHSLKVVKVQLQAWADEVEAVFIGGRSSDHVYSEICMTPTEDTWRVHGLTKIDSTSLQRLAQDATMLNERFMTFVKRYQIKAAEFKSEGCIERMATTQRAPGNATGTASPSLYRPGFQLLCESSCNF